MRTETNEAPVEHPQTRTDLRAKVSLFCVGKAYLLTLTSEGRLPATEELNRLATNKRINLLPVDSTGRTHPTHQRLVRLVCLLEPVNWEDFFHMIDAGWIESIHDHDA